MLFGSVIGDGFMHNRPAGTTFLQKQWVTGSWEYWLRNVRVFSIGVGTLGYPLSLTTSLLKNVKRPKGQGD